ncbi:MAG: DNA-3-methyladenine glycosylase I [Chloroflexi bacterium]|nr:DNA-3-methyladenine glycosylase I [Chloroflexota bacterium]
MTSNLQRCPWGGGDPLYTEYHDKEWGVPVHDDQRLFEMLILEGAQAGLSWITILRKRAAYRVAFDDFDPHKIARYDQARVAKLLQNPGIIRNKLKVNAAVSNAQTFLEVQEQFGSFKKYCWQFVGGQPMINQWESQADHPTQTRESQAMSQDMKSRGFKFVGPTICYAFMQATGMVNDHLINCFRYKDVQRL